MKTSELLEKLRDLGVRLWVEGSELKVSAPKGALTPELRDCLIQHKRELLNMLRPSSTATEVVIPRASRNEPLPLSYTQQRLWFLDQMEPGVITYNMWAALRLIGDLDVDVLEKSLQEVVRRHEVLRTTFRSVDGVPQQVVHDDFVLEMEYLGGRASELSTEEVGRILLDRLERPFDLENGPLVRGTLVRRNPDEHAIIVVVHHIVFDGLSISLMFRELGAIYEAYCAGKPSPLEEMPIQYGDYAAWQRNLFEEGELDRRMEHWSNVLSGNLPILELPTDFSRPSVQTFNGTAESAWLDDEVPHKIDELAKRDGSTAFLILLAAYQAFLHRITGQEDILIGTVMANRLRPEVQKLLGYFVNTLVLRCGVDGDPTFRDLMKKCRDIFFGAVEHQDMPFEKLVDEIQPERNLAYSPLFQTLFVLDQDGGEERAMGNIKILPFIMENRVARTDLVVHGYRGRDAIGREGRLKIGMEYNTDLFEPATIKRWLRCYEVMLTAALAKPDTPISRLPILRDDERRQILREWNATDAEYSDQPTHIQFESQVDATPDALALVFPGADGDRELTYAELDQAANRLARYLVDRGVQAGSLVGLSLDRSAEMVIGLLGIIKAGAAYVPLYPSYPSDRLAYMVEDAQLEFCVTSSHLRSLLPDGLMTIELDQVEDQLAQLDASRLEPRAKLDDRMYVIYTSGSTGRPKGVELEHRSVSNFLASMAREPGLTSEDSLLAVTTLSFDISVLEVMLPLLNGATLIVAPREAVGDGAELIALLDRFGPTVMQATPATWRMLMLAGWTGREDLRVFSGGEALPRDLANGLVPLCKELWNLYGPTETTIWSSVRRVHFEEGPVTIGHPIACTRMYVLDAHLEPVPVGIPGELYIGGDGLARGYLGRPELTEERFVKDPFEGKAGARMYRTGDKARWLATGELECLGRIDNQVKLRGFRIELGEIESVLEDVEGVHQCVCVIREDTPGDQRLTAYYVNEGQGGPTSESGALRDAAQDKLPAYMVPAAFVLLDELPHTPNGKVDRNALLAMKKVEAAVEEAEIVAPRNDLERDIAKVWGEILGVDRVSINTNFFDLGGHSLLLARVRSRLKEVLGTDLSIIELFQYPTVSALATQVEAKRSNKSTTAATERKRDLSTGRKALMRRRRR